MKVFIVTDGTYSDYMIERVFSNLPAAEEYKKWHGIRNDIEEYEVHDEPFCETDGKKVMFIRVQGTVYPEAVVDIRYTIRPDLMNVRKAQSGVGLCDYKPSGVFSIYSYYYIPIDMWDEEKYKAKFTKALYDYAYIAKSLFMEGARARDVERALNERSQEDIND